MFFPALLGGHEVEWACSSRGSGGSGGWGRGVRGGSWGAKRCPGYRCARSIENFCRIKMVVARASGTDLASRLRRDTFWMEFRVAEGLDG